LENAAGEVLWRSENLGDDGLIEPTSNMTQSQEQGLTAAQAAERLTRFGPNATVEPQVSTLRRVAHRLWEPVPWMLEAAIVVQWAIGEKLEAFVIALLLAFNVALGVFQEGATSARRWSLSIYTRRSNERD